MELRRGAHGQGGVAPVLGEHPLHKIGGRGSKGIGARVKAEESGLYTCITD